jgi:ketosteroid isomerase-like protein
MESQDVMSAECHRRKKGVGNPSWAAWRTSLFGLLEGTEMNNKRVVEEFWSVMSTNDFHAAAALLHDEFTLDWPQSGERIRGRDHFAAINTAYPSKGRWCFTIDRILAEGDLVVTDVAVSDGSRQDRAITFSTIRDGRILSQVEYWPESFAPPQWRAKLVERIG